MGGDSQGTSYVNIEGNLFINGPAKGGTAFGGNVAMEFERCPNGIWVSSRQVVDAPMSRTI